MSIDDRTVEVFSGVKLSVKQIHLDVLWPLFRYDVFSMDRKWTVRLPRYGHFKTTGLKPTVITAHYKCLYNCQGKTVVYTLYKSAI